MSSAERLAGVNRGHPMQTMPKTWIVGSLTLLLAACGDTSQLPEQAQFGPNPTLPEPNQSLIPTAEH